MDRDWDPLNFHQLASRIDQAQQRADRLAAGLRELGIDPDSLDLGL